MSARHSTSTIAVVISCFVFAACGSKTSPAGAAALHVQSPSSGASVGGRIPVAASLTTGGEGVVSAEFFVDGKSIGRDDSAPFASRPGARFAIPQDASGQVTLDFSARYRTRVGSSMTVSTPITVAAASPARPTPLTGKKSYRLTFDDEFSDPAMSDLNWNRQRRDWIKGPIPYSNLEGAGYSPSNVSVSDGLLNLVTSDRRAGDLPHSTGSVNSNKLFSYKYGYIESKVFVPDCTGCWPSFWQLSVKDHWPPEIDVFEFFNTEKNGMPYAALHWSYPDADKQRYISRKLMPWGSNLVGTWHTYGMLWTKKIVRVWVDGLQRVTFKSRHIPRVAMYPIMQLAVGKGYHAPAGNKMQVDYVRVWQPKR
ncbi:MAG: family 16 glycosylhydrolase [Solirubrobacterales bacterium]